MTTDRIEINPAVMMGKPVIRGTRIPVELILRKLSEGATEADLLDAYPRLTHADFQAALAYAADARRAYFEHACRVFEQRYRMSSEEFMQQFQSGALDDDSDYFDWYAAKRGLDLWERRFRILSGVEV